jgi:hypothetical protein
LVKGHHPLWPKFATYAHTYKGKIMGVIVFYFSLAIEVELCYDKNTDVKKKIDEQRPKRKKEERKKKEVKVRKRKGTKEKS